MSAVPKPRQQLRMMIVDDSNVMRRRIERSQQNDLLEVVGTAVNGLDAVTKFKQLMPDVMTLDLTMPEMDGIECVEHVIKIKPDVLILVVSALADKATAVQDYAGVIGISGNREGKVYFTAPRGMLSVMLMCMNETDTGEQNVRDLVGEVANTIPGNARRDFGRNFIISTPTVCDKTNAATAAATNGRSFIIPINWRSYSANVVVCLQ